MTDNRCWISVSIVIHLNENHMSEVLEISQTSGRDSTFGNVNDADGEIVIHTVPIGL